MLTEVAGPDGSGEVEVIIQGPSSKRSPVVEEQPGPPFNLPNERWWRSDGSAPGTRSIDKDPHANSPQEQRILLGLVPTLKEPEEQVLGLANVQVTGDHLDGRIAEVGHGRPRPRVRVRGRGDSETVRRVVRMSEDVVYNMFRAGRAKGGGMRRMIRRRSKAG